MNYNERIDNIISQLEQLKNHNEEADRLISFYNNILNALGVSYETTFALSDISAMYTLQQAGSDEWYSLGYEYDARKECEKLIDKARNEIVERINNS